MSAAPIPGELYDLAATLSAARAITFAAMDSLPNYGGVPEMGPAVEHLGDLITGLQILLNKAKDQVDLLT